MNQAALPEWQLSRQASENAILHQLYIDISRIIPFLQANPYWLNAKNISSLIFISTVIKQLMLMIFFFLFFRPRILRKKRKKKRLLYIDILYIDGTMKNDVRFEYIPWKNVWLCFISIACVHVSHKTEKFRFLKYFQLRKRCQILVFPRKHCPIWFTLHCFRSILKIRREIKILNYNEIV